MDQQKSSAKSKKTILRYLPGPTSSVSFQNPSIYSPSRDKRSTDKPHKSNLGIGFSGPMVSMVLADTRRKVKINHDHIPVYEPTSPRVSCMGTVKCKNKKNKPQKPVNRPPTNKVLRLTSATPESPTNNDHKKESKKKLGFKKIFGGITPSRSDSGKKNSEAPSLGAMKRFSSGRDKLSNIDWTKEVAARRYDSDEESDDERVVVPSSAPVIIRNSLGFDDNIVRIAGLNHVEPRNEINLWKRRTMQQPKPLQLQKV
ncbi:hypothetical protein HanRHA438_Chr14g0632211 [Helianthus annuus]|uniref:Syringolide-induced protein 14-1-1 n=1 Tax=Helianthus annuus TaxID=4232 RepID=A0A251SDH1_HELAN|nr:uncharacterized protein At1g76070 [Helianthus annuus]KAF5767265.1 hypothetical protein HanXRQr2_Chr14g0622301 [Helianthus annuus]KAJ0466555.1 hypothetical protein HanIR_Chr14g0673441 [Helianthus annuus]KAJ0484198.1 hypothetical protein HanHA89_Chr14g0541441 [Helianthus annuus]KAJ0658500.1 hypothetical protein HanOQP8_Chr14g0508931 [Helianthus annuus]KAJ0851908.1 hypothetical protein HanRHA438_Chr14g0632211 [Helianthus annuus]